MMRDVLTLIKRGNMRDRDGYRIPSDGARRTVFAEYRTPSRSEFYNSMQAGVETSAVFVIYNAEYENEREVEHNGKRYRVTRTYRRNASDFIELNCTDSGEAENGETNV